MGTGSGRGFCRVGLGVAGFRFTVWELGIEPIRATGLFAQFSNALLHLFARFETDDELFRHVDLLARFRIPRTACRSKFHLENAKIPQLDSAFTNQHFDDRIERPLHHVFGLLLSQSEFFGDDSDNFFFSHSVSTPIPVGLVTQNMIPGSVTATQTVKYARLRNQYCMDVDGRVSRRHGVRKSRGWKSDAKIGCQSSRQTVSQ